MGFPKNPWRRIWGNVPPEIDRESILNFLSVDFLRYE